MSKRPPFPDTPEATLARYLRSQIALAAVKPVGCVQINNAEAELAANALEIVAVLQREQRKGLCVECGAEVVDNSGTSGE